jgi:hypothetical protein
LFIFINDIVIYSVSYYENGKIKSVCIYNKIYKSYDETGILNVICNYISDYEYDYNGHLIKIISNKKKEYTKIYMDSEYIAIIKKNDININNSLDINLKKDYNKFEYIKNFIIFLKKIDPFETYLKCIR